MLNSQDRRRYRRSLLRALAGSAAYVLSGISDGVVSVPNQTFTSVAVNTNGWELDAIITASKVGGAYANLNNYSTPGLALTVRSISWTTGGVQTTIDRTVIAVSTLRKSYPNDASRDEAASGSDVAVKLTLSSRIYQSDSIVSCSLLSGFFTDNGAGGSGGASPVQAPSVANGSTQAYPQPQACWLDHDLQHVKSATYSPRLFVNHGYGQQGQPVRAVKFTATDQSSNVATAIASSLSSGSWASSGLYANYFTAPLNFAGLNQGDLVTIDATIYPWVGDAYVISVSGEAYPSPNLSIMKVLNDRTGAFGTVYGYVDGVGGGTPAVNTNPVTAATTPFASLNAAMAAAQTYNNANFGRNDTAGVILRIAAGVTITGLAADTWDTNAHDGLVPIVIEGVNRATSVYISEATSSNNDIPNTIKLKNMTIKKVAGSIIMFDGNNSVGCMIIAEQCTFDLNGNAAYQGWWHQCGRKVFIDCDGVDCGQMSILSTNASATMLAVGNSFLSGDSAIYNAIANKGSNVAVTSASGVGLGAFKGVCWAFNSLSRNSTAANIIQINSVDLGPRGAAVVGNVCERYGSAGSSAAFLVSGDGDVTSVENINIICNTVVGERANILYQDAGHALVAKNGFVWGNVFNERNTKTDTFNHPVDGPDGVRIGNWVIRYGVDCGFNTMLRGDSSGDVYSNVGWLGEVAARGEVSGTNASPVNPHWTNDQSLDGGAAGGGNYRPTSAGLGLIPAGLTRFAVDLNGTAIPTNGTAYQGACQA